MVNPVARLRAALTDASSLRSWTVDTNDGIIATAGILEGFAGAGANDSVLITAGVVAALAGGLSLGGAKWSEASSEREAQLRVAAEEAEHLATSPEEEILELIGYYEGRGLDPELAAQAAEQLSARDALAAQLETEYGIREVMPASAPGWAGVSAMIAFMLGAVVPLLITVLVPVQLETWAILLAVIASLILTATIGARSGHTRLWRTLTRTLTVGLGTLGISYLVGLLLF